MKQPKEIDEGDLFDRILKTRLPRKKKKAIRSKLQKKYIEWCKSFILK